MFKNISMSQFLYILLLQKALVSLRSPGDVRGMRQYSRVFLPLRSNINKTRFDSGLCGKVVEKMDSIRMVGSATLCQDSSLIQNENNIALVIVSGPCDPSGIVM